MTRIQTLEQSVHDLYDAHNPEREDWADWLNDNHVFVVADNASKLAQRFGVNEELARAAALLHDIADTRMSRFNETHEETSLEIARELMQQAGFAETEIQLVVDDAIKWHSCHDDHVPSSQEGKILATADAQAHLLTDFYAYIAWVKGKEGKSLEEVKQFALKKLERDFHKKIHFDEVRAECQPAYTILKSVFSL